jgi:hypothetical protein
MTTMPGPASPAGAPTGGEGAKTKHVLILVLGILGIVCCPILAPIAWIMGKNELAAIRGGQSASDEGMTKAGMIIGIIGTIWLGLSIILMLIYGAAIIAMITGAANQGVGG